MTTLEQKRNEVNLCFFIYSVVHQGLDEAAKKDFLTLLRKEHEELIQIKNNGN